MQGNFHGISSKPRVKLVSLWTTGPRGRGTGIKFHEPADYGLKFTQFNSIYFKYFYEYSYFTHPLKGRQSLQFLPTPWQTISLNFNPSPKRQIVISNFTHPLKGRQSLLSQAQCLLQFFVSTTLGIKRLRNLLLKIFKDKHYISTTAACLIYTIKLLNFAIRANTIKYHMLKY